MLMAFQRGFQKYILFQGGPNFGEGWSKNLGKMGKIGTSIVMQIGGDQFRKGMLVPTSWYQNLCDASLSYLPDQILEKNEK